MRIIVWISSVNYDEDIKCKYFWWKIKVYFDQQILYLRKMKHEIEIFTNSVFIYNWKWNLFLEDCVKLLFSTKPNLSWQFFLLENFQVVISSAWQEKVWNWPVNGQNFVLVSSHIVQRSFGAKKRKNRIWDEFLTRIFFKSRDVLSLFDQI